MISFTKEKFEATANGLAGKEAVDVEGCEKRKFDAPSAGEPSWMGKCRWDRLSGGRDKTSWKFSDALLVEGSENTEKINS